MKSARSTRLSRRGFLVGAGAGATGLALGMCHLKSRNERDAGPVFSPPSPKTPVTQAVYGD
ncbi:MAG: twin-arginine translocation signal domain-containing protein, partial [Deltaproteobacteria bacterium]|nr:twin-arginine translocation signal domain-containing protein [Deltaproteobacteria bacterium]